MPRLPLRFAAAVLAFAPLFSHRSWRHAEVLPVGAILAPGERAVASLLRISGLARERRFVNHHRVLNRAVWGPRAASRLLLGLLLDGFVPRGPVVLGLDDTIERRRGKRIGAKGIHRDPVRSSHGRFAKTSGLRWLGLVLPAPWAGRVWALPFLTALAPSERHRRERGKRHKKLTDGARRLALQARRWLPGRELVLVADSGFAVLGLPASLGRRGATCITRLRPDAALYDPAPPRLPGTNGRSRPKGGRLPNLSEVLADAGTGWRRVVVPGWYGEGERAIDFCSATAVWRHGGMPIVPIRWVPVRDPLGRFAPQALLCTDAARGPEEVLRWFVQRWRLEATFREVRDHLGVETQRQWSDLAIARTTPCLLGLFSLTALLAARLNPADRLGTASSAWYRKRHPTFSDTLAAVRRHFWREQGLLTSRRAGEAAKLQPSLQRALAYALCHAA